jgi:hypothetical protein
LRGGGNILNIDINKVVTSLAQQIGKLTVDLTLSNLQVAELMRQVEDLTSQIEELTKGKEAAQG